MEAGDLIRRFRKSKGWTQNELAFELGVTKAYISAVENDTKALSLNQLLRFATALEIPSKEIDRIRIGKKRKAPSSSGEFEELIKAKDNLNRFLTEMGMAKETSETMMLPVVGVIPAGTPVLNFEDAHDLADEEIPILKKEVRHSRCFFLKVRGDSMIDIGIHENDLVLIDPEDTQIGGRGRVMAVYIDNEVTLKTVLRLSETRVRLIPENTRYAPMEVDMKKKRVRIIGAVLPFMIRWNEKLSPNH
ncbi:helix-turn-helix domain-containing protein [bacterium]|nr:helix-turn-helix domain-containing protein [bacterium]